MILLTSVLAVLCPIMPALCAHRHGLVPYASPLHLVAGLAFFGVTLKVAAMQFAPDLAFHLSYTHAPGAILWGVFYVALFLTAICAGYLSLCRARISVPPLHGVGGLTAPAAVALTLAITHLLFSQRGLSILDPTAFAIVNSVKQFAVNENNVGATGALTKLLYTVPKLLFVLCVVAAIRRGRLVDAVGAMAVFSALVLAALASGDRFDLARLLILTLLAAALAGWRFRLRSTVFAAALLAGTIGAAAVMSAWRHGGDTAPHTEIARQITGSTYFLDVNVSTILVARMTPEQALSGDSYGWWVFGWVPRALWPGKPATDAGSYLKRDVLGHGPNAVGAINVTGPGEAFLNFGWWGVLVGAGLGIAFRVMELATLGAGRAVLYPVVVMPLVIAWLQSSFSAALVSAGFALVLCLATLAVLRISRPSASVAVA